MAVYSNIYGNHPIEYIGCTLNWYERNGYDDSDWYAVVWDEKTQSVKEINYDTTRCGGSGWAKIDATKEVLCKVYRYYYQIGRSIFDSYTNQNQAKKICKGDMVIIVRGRKIQKGTIASVFWVGTCYNPYNRQHENRIGLEIDGERCFINANYAEVVDWERRLIHGKERKCQIRNYAINSMPAHYRKLFVNR